MLLDKIKTALNGLLREERSFFQLKQRQLRKDPTQKKLLSPVLNLTVADLLTALADEKSFISEIGRHVGLLTAEELMGELMVAWAELGQKRQEELEEAGWRRKIEGNIERFEYETQLSATDRGITLLHLKEISQLAREFLKTARTGLIPDDYRETQHIVNDFITQLKELLKEYSLDLDLNRRISIDDSEKIFTPLQVLEPAKAYMDVYNIISRNLCALEALDDTCELIRQTPLRGFDRHR